MPFTPDHALVDRIHSGDPEAFTELMLRYTDTLRRFAYGLLGDVATADDVVQDVFATVWTNRARWSPTHGIQTYLFGAVRNRALDSARHIGVRRRVDAVLTEALTHSASESAPPSPDAHIEQSHVTAALRAALQDLTERRRTALRLRYMEQMTVPDIAQVMGISVKAAEQLVWQAIHALRRTLDSSSTTR